MANTSGRRLRAAARARYVEGLCWAKAAARARITERTLQRMRTRRDADWLAAVKAVCERAKRQGKPLLREG